MTQILLLLSILCIIQAVHKTEKDVHAGRTLTVTSTLRNDRSGYRSYQIYFDV